METRVSGKECWTVYVLATLVAFAMMRYGFVASSASMHLRADYDLNIYYLIGNAWMHGLLPYESFADLKGPVVFLLHGLCSLLSPGSFLGICIVNALIVGLGCLFAYKSARLFFNVSGAAAVLCCHTYFLLYFAANPAEPVWVLQHVALYWVLCWATKRTNSFSTGQLLFLGFSVALVLLLKFNLVAYWVPVCVLALCLNKWRGFFWMLMGWLVCVAPFVIYFWWHGALLSMWREYVETALIYGRCPWGECALSQKHFALFRGIMPYHLYSRIPDWILAIPGCVLCFAWVLMWRIKSLLLNKASLWVLLSAFILSAYASYSGRYDFLHYAFIFYPFCFLSLVYGAVLLKARPRLLLLMGTLTCLGVVLVSVSLPLYVKYGRTYNGNAEMKETAERLVSWMNSKPGEDIFILDASKGLHLYRLSGRLPAIKHFVPPITREGSAMHRSEQVDYIRKHAPRYLIGSEWDKAEEIKVLHRAGVPYKMTTHREFGLPAYPPHARQPEIIIYTRQN